MPDRRRVSRRVLFMVAVVAIGTTLAWLMYPALGGGTPSFSLAVIFTVAVALALIASDRRKTAGKVAAEPEAERMPDPALHRTDSDAAAQFESTDFQVKAHHDKVRIAAREAAAAIEKIFDDAIAAGRITQEALFDRTYTPIPDTNPQKFTSRFDAFTDEALPQVQDRILEQLPYVVFAATIDNKCYTATHNAKFSKPLTGNYETDLANNRTKRIFSDQSGMRAATNTKPFLLQTYKRDTGEVMHDLSVPIYVNNRHWGAFRIGYDSLLD